jgi:hypothetical protein
MMYRKIVIPKIICHEATVGCEIIFSNLSSTKYQKLTSFVINLPTKIGTVMPGKVAIVFVTAIKIPGCCKLFYRRIKNITIYYSPA